MPKYVRKTFKPRRKAYKPRPRKMAKKVATLSRQVALLKPEKKHQTGNIINYVGQINGNDGGYLTLDMTLSNSQAVTEGGRIGSQVKVSGFFTQMQITPMSANVNGGVLEIELWRIVGYPTSNAYTYSTNPTGSAQNPAELIYNSDAFVNNAVKSIVDTNSLRNMDFVSNFKLIRKTKVYFPQKNDAINTTRVKTIKFGAKFPKGMVVSFNKNTTNVNTGAFFMLIKSNIGNISTITGGLSTLNNVPIKIINSGFEVAMNWTTYFTDC